MKDLIYKLTACSAISGDEHSIHKLIENEIKDYVKTISFELDGSVIATTGNIKSDRNILFDAHLDQIGMLVTNIENVSGNGFIKFCACGGVDRRVLPSHIVEIHGSENILGIICPIYNNFDKNKDDNFLPIEDLTIDCDMVYDELIKKVSLGDRVSFVQKFRNLLNNQFTTCSLDNRIGVAVLINLIRKLSKIKLNNKITFLFSSQEEVTTLGAKVSSYKINPDKAIVVDTSFANQPNLSSQKYKNINMGDGPMIALAPTISKNISNKLINIAKDKNIHYQLEVMGGNTGTNLDKIVLTRGGINCGLVSIPIKYMHSPIEVANFDDINNTTELLFNYILSEENDNL